MKNHAVNRVLLTVIWIFTITYLLIGCSCGSRYNQFSEGLDFTFEYPSGEWPDGWLVAPVFRYSTLVTADLLGPKSENPEHESAVDVGISIWIKLKLEPEEEAQEKISNDISIHANTPNFDIIRQENITIEGIDGYLVEYSYDYDMSLDTAPDKGYLLPTRVLNIAIPRNEKVYQIRISASQNEWDLHEKDIKHILDTFRWK